MEQLIGPHPCADKVSLMFRMTNPVQDYAWGSTTALTRLFEWPETQTPRAEVWMGAHPAAPSSVQWAPTAGGEGSPAQDEVQTLRLDELLSRHPEYAGSCGSPEPGTTAVPYLLKVLAAAQPLSIQVHPDKERAQAGYDAENAAGVPLDAPERNYKDGNHKPELIVALTEFAALCGFRPHAEAAADLAVLRDALEARDAGDVVLSCLDRLQHRLEQQDHAAALEHLLRSGREESVAAARAVNALFSRRARRADDPPTDGDPESIPAGGSAAEETPQPAPSSAAPLTTPELPAKLLDTLTRISRAFPGDPGILVTLLLNRVDLSPGEALYLPAGNLHAYLHGVGVEIMANSDNVLRGGLTSKHIDVDELLAATDPQVLPLPHCAAEASGAGRFSYRPPFEEFQLKRIQFPEAGGPVGLRPQGPAVLLCTQSAVELRLQEGSAGAGPESLRLTAGESAFLPASRSYTVDAAGQGAAQAFLAVPGTAPEVPMPENPAPETA